MSRAYDCGMRNGDSHHESLWDSHHDSLHHDSLSATISDRSGFEVRNVVTVPVGI